MQRGISRSFRLASLLDQLRLGWQRLEMQPAAASRLLFASWGVTRAILFAGMLLGASYCDPQFYNYAGKLAAGHWPYTAAVPVEYPPLAMVLILLPALPLLPFAAIAPRPDPVFNHITDIPTLRELNPVRYGAYGISFAVEMLVFDALTLWLVQRAARKFVPGDPTGLRSGLLYVLLIFLNGALLQKFDLVAGLCCLVALLALTTGRNGAAWSMLAVATLIKGYPALAIPLLIGYQVCQSRQVDLVRALRERARPILTGALSYVATIGVATLLVWLFAGPQGILHSILYQGDRGTEIESLYANVLLIFGWIPGLHVYTIFNPQDLSRIVKSSLDNAVGVVSTLLLAVSLVLAYGAYARALQRWRLDPAVARKPAASLQLVGAGIVAVSLAFLLCFRALPVHYWLGILPIAALLRLPGGRLQRLWLVSLCTVAIAGQLVTTMWHSLVLLQPEAIVVLSLRNSAWILAFGAVLLALWLPRTSAAPRRTAGVGS